MHRISLIAALACLLAGSALAAPRYTLTDLGQNVVPADINNSGQWTGSANDAAVLFDGTNLIQLSKPGQARSIGAGAAINSHGQVTGTWENHLANQMSAFLYSNGLCQDISFPDSRNTYGRGINDAGDVVGRVDPKPGTSGPFGAFLYSAGQHTELHDAIGESDNWARAINASGQIVGGAVVWSYPQKSIQVAYVYDHGKPTRTKGTNSEAFSINDSGQFVGESNAAVSHGHNAFLYSNGEFTDLGGLSTRPFTTALHINNLGQIVGRSLWAEFYIPEDPPPDLGHAFLYSDGQMHDLNDLCDLPAHWVLQEASAINDRGQIVGVTGGGHGFLLTPIPEPISLPFLLFPLLPLILRPTRLARK